MQVVKVPGLPVILDGREFIIPPITLGALVQLQGGLEQISTTNFISKESVETILCAALSALNRNYPEVTRADLENWIDVANIKDVFDAVVDVSGLRRKAHEAGKTTPRET